MLWIKENIWLIAFIVWGLPLGSFRSRFRKMVYGTDDWTINIKPYFVKETRALLGLMEIDHREFEKTRNYYRFYLTVYLVLFLAYKFTGN